MITSVSNKSTGPIMTPLFKNDHLARLNHLFKTMLPVNAFQQQRLGRDRRCHSLEDYLTLPFLTKKDLVEDSLAHPPFGSNVSYPLDAYTYYHQTSGTTGEPLRILDTPATWEWWGRCWLEVYKQAGVTSADRLFFAFSFAPSIGFWSAYHGGTMLGALCIPAGGASSIQRLRMILDNDATVLMCTPSYALRLAEIANKENIAIADSGIRVIIAAGEPGASIPGTRHRIESAWNAALLDHAGATEVGAWGIGCPQGEGLYVNEDAFIAEVLHPDTGEPVTSGECGELVLTNLERDAWPVVRYRTGDIVRPIRQSSRDSRWSLLLKGGILGRVDDMITIRGVNIFPSAIENIIRQSAGISEFRITATRENEMDVLQIEIENSDTICQTTAARCREQLGLNVEITSVPENSLMRWEAKARRFVDLRQRASRSEEAGNRSA